MNPARLIKQAINWTALTLLWPVNSLLCLCRRGTVHENSVLHISYMVHIPYYMTRILRRHGIRADYLALGDSPHWERCDYNLMPCRIPLVGVLREFWLFWTVVAKYEVIHLHFMIPMSSSGWELPLLKRMGRKVVIHYRGCEIRDRETNQALHPECNICEDCDYGGASCTGDVIHRRRALAEKYGDAFLVTTPDMKDFVPEAGHFPFFAPEDLPEQQARTDRNDEVKIVHATNHPGLEGTDRIREALDRLEAKGYPLRFGFLMGVSHDEVLRALADADLSIGKMKMGYYANAQIESMCLGVPTITNVRPEFMTHELRDSGFIFTTLDDLEATIERYLQHPDELDAKRRIARESILRIHDNDRLANRLIALYNRLKAAS